MASAKFFDRYASTLASGYTSGGTSLSVASAGAGASALPASGDFYVVVEADGSNTEEVLLVTAVSGTTLTVSGAKAGTAASNHGSGAVLRGPVLTAAAISQMKLDIASSMTVAAFDTETTAGTLNPNGRGVVQLSDGLYRCIWNGSAWEYYHGGRRAIRPVDSQFAWLNQSTSSVNTTSGGIFLLQPFGATQYLAIRKKTAPATPYTITAKLIHNIYPIDFMGFGLTFGDGTKQHTFGLLWSAGAMATNMDKWNSATSYSAAYSSIANRALSSEIWLRISDNGTNRICSMSNDGLNFRVYHTVGRTDFLTATEVGFYSKAQNGSQDGQVMLVSWQEA